jgi:SH3-like domain-containing protein
LRDSRRWLGLADSLTSGPAEDKEKGGALATVGTSGFRRKSSVFRVSMPSTALAAFLAAIVFMPVGAAPSAAQGAATTVGPTGSTGLPLPRFVSLKSAKVNSRIGPGSTYPVEWLYLKAGLPMEIIQEFDNWRRVRDADGAEGWINQSLLSGRRTAIVAPWQNGKEATFDLLAQPSREARKVAAVEPGAIGSIRMCNGDWCQMTFEGHTGWISQTLVWGAYPGEAIKD